MNRRTFLTGMAGILAAGTAPWVVTKAGVLMPVRNILVPETWKSEVLALLYHGDGSCTYTFGNWTRDYPPHNVKIDWSSTPEDTRSGIIGYSYWAGAEQSA